MSFTCSACRLHQPPRTKPEVIVTEWRAVEYGASSGVEAAKSAQFCPRCAPAARLASEQAKRKISVLKILPRKVETETFEYADFE